jgi:hypothetical protein
MVTISAHCARRELQLYDASYVCSFSIWYTQAGQGGRPRTTPSAPRGLWRRSLGREVLRAPRMAGTQLR